VGRRLGTPEGCGDHATLVVIAGTGTIVYVHWPGAGRTARGLRGWAIYSATEEGGDAPHITLPEYQHCPLLVRTSLPEALAQGCFGY